MLDFIYVDWQSVAGQARCDHLTGLGTVNIGRMSIAVWNQEGFQPVQDVRLESSQSESVFFIILWAQSEKLIDPFNPSLNTYVRNFNIHLLRVLPNEYIYRFCIIHGVNSYFSRRQHWLIFVMGMFCGFFEAENRFF
jgi:hypothetical protein